MTVIVIGMARVSYKIVGIHKLIRSQILDPKKVLVVFVGDSRVDDRNSDRSASREIPGGLHPDLIEMPLMLVVRIIGSRKCGHVVVWFYILNPCARFDAFECLGRKASNPDPFFVL